MTARGLFNELGVVREEIVRIGARDPLIIDAEIVRRVVGAFLHRAKEGIPQRARVHDNGDLILGARRSEADAGR